MNEQKVLKAVTISGNSNAGMPYIGGVSIPSNNNSSNISSGISWPDSSYSSLINENFLSASDLREATKERVRKLLEDDNIRDILTALIEQEFSKFVEEFIDNPDKKILESIISDQLDEKLKRIDNAIDNLNNRISYFEAQIHGSKLPSNMTDYTMITSSAYISTDNNKAVDLKNTNINP